MVYLHVAVFQAYLLFCIYPQKVGVSDLLVLLYGVAQILVDFDDTQSIDFILLHHAVELGGQHDICKVKFVNCSR